MSRTKQTALYFASALIPCFIYLLVLYVLGIAPFGDITILVSDAAGQYLDFAAYWKTVLSGDNSIFYTFAKTLGGNGFNLVAYYLLSPFNLLYALSSIEALPLFYTAIILLKVSLCGLSFFILTSYRRGCNASNLIFSTSYALMAYNVLYAYHTMWLDGVLILPILVLGLCKLIENKSPIAYICALGYALATNFYIGYMLCIASILFFAALLFIANTSTKKRVSLCFRFISCSAIAGFGTAVFWLPAIVSLLGDRSQTNPISNLTGNKFGITGFLASFSSGSCHPTFICSVYPLIFCGSFVLVLVMLFFLNKQISIKKKIAAFFLIGIFLFSFYFELPNVIWHGFSTVNSFDYRYSFIFCFLLITIAYEQFHSSCERSAKKIIITSALITAVLLCSYLRNPSVVRPAGIITTLIAILFIAICLLIHTQSKYKTIALLLIVAAELTINCYLCWGTIIKVTEPLSKKEFSDYSQSTQEALDYIKSTDPGFYRIEKTFFRTNNDSALFDYAGLTHFSSTEPVSTKVFMRKMGLPTHYNFWSGYFDGSTSETDAFLGVKYLLTDGSFDLRKDYTLLNTINGISIYKNDFSLPLAILSGNDINNILLDDAAPFDLHNQIWKGLISQENQVLIETPYSISTVNLFSITNPDGSITYHKEDVTQPSSIRYDVPISSELPLYYYFTAPDSLTYPNSPEIQDVSIFINGKDCGVYFDFHSWNMACAGLYEVGETVSIELVPNQDVITVSNAWFCYEDTSSLNDLSEQIQNQELQLHKLSSSHFEGTFIAGSDQTLLLTIPYDPSWHMTIDDQPVQTHPVLDTLLAADIPAGQHTFELYYIPAGLQTGLFITVLTYLTCVAWIILKKRPVR